MWEPGAGARVEWCTECCVLKLVLVFKGLKVELADPATLLQVVTGVATTQGGALKSLQHQLLLPELLL